jgi:hypothetical protein
MVGVPRSSARTSENRQNPRFEAQRRNADARFLRRSSESARIATISVRVIRVPGDPVDTARRGVTVAESRNGRGDRIAERIVGDA